MCLVVITAHLGHAHAALDAARYLLAFAPGLTPGQRRLLARQVLSGAGQEQLPDSEEVVCLCGFGLDVDEPGSPRHLRPAAFAAAWAAKVTHSPAVAVGTAAGAVAV